MKPKTLNLDDIDALLFAEPDDEGALRAFAVPVEGGGFEWLARRAGKPGDGSNDFIASTAKEARDGDIIDQASWKLGHYRKNPVILDNHDPSHVVGRASDVRVIDGQLRATIQWDDSDANPRGKLVAHQHREGFRKAVSVRWLPGKRTRRNELDPSHPAYSKGRKVKTPWGEEVVRVGDLHENNTLLEISSVSIPSDPRALQTRGFSDGDAARLRGEEPEVPALEFDPADFVRVADLPGLLLKFLRSAPARLAIRAMSLTEPTTTPNKPEPRGDGLDHLFS